MVSPAFSLRARKNDWYINTAANYTYSGGYYAPSPTEKEQKALTNSDLHAANIYLQTGFATADEERRESQNLDIQVGAQFKNAGAGMFYGFGSQDQFDATRTALGSATYSHTWGVWSLEAQAMYRANYDRYEWHRSQRLYGNFHFTQNTAANLRVHYASRIGRTTVGLELRNENIHSTNLGDTINPTGQVPNVDGFKLADVRVLDLVRGCNRLNINYFAEQSFFWRNLSASLGVSGNWNTMYGNNVSGGANIGYEYARDGRVYINANRSLRLPTFTDLYYNAGNQLGNRDLKPEEAWTLSLGTQYITIINGSSATTKRAALNGSSAALRQTFSLSANAYYRWGRNIIDWVYTPEDTKRPFHAQNHNIVNAAGVEASARYAHNAWLRSVGVSYAYTYLDLDLSKSGSRYLDYLSHKLLFNLNHAFYTCRNWTLGGNYNFTFQKREGQYNNAEGEVCNYAPVSLLDVSLYWENPRVKISADCTNITNTRYYDYGGILQPGAWAKLTAELRL